MKQEFQSEFWTDLLGDHIEFDHERELFGPRSYEELKDMHNKMHEISDHWEHTH